MKNIDYFNNRNNDIIIKSGTGEIIKTVDNVPDLTFEVNTSETIVIELPRIYYMGYQLEENGQKIELTESDNGFLQATIQQSGTYTLTYEKTTIMKLANILNLGTVIVLVGMAIMKKKKVKLLVEKT